MVDTEKLAAELEAAGWPSVADDAREGVPPATLVLRLWEIGEATSEAVAIIAEHEEI